MPDEDGAGPAFRHCTDILAAENTYFGNAETPARHR
jgi:hypothetical protein